MDSKLKKKNFLILHTFGKDNNFYAFQDFHIHNVAFLVSLTVILFGNCRVRNSWTVVIFVWTNWSLSITYWHWPFEAKVKLLVQLLGPIVYLLALSVDLLDCAYHKIISIILMIFTDIWGCLIWLGSEGVNIGLESKAWIPWNLSFCYIRCTGLS